MTQPTPWWNALKLRQEILDASGQIDDVQMSLFRAVHGDGSQRPAYADATYYGAITHPTDRLVELLTEVAIRIGGEEDYVRARAVTRLDQGMGGGKSHACIGAFHLAANPEALLATQLGQQVAARAKQRLGRPLPTGLSAPHVVVLPCDNMTPGAPTELDGPASSLFERFLWRLFSKDYVLYERYKEFFSDKAKIIEALRALNRPVLIIVDEVLDYIGKGLDGVGRADLTAQDMGFLRALLDAANDVPHVALLAVMISSDRDSIALSSDAEGRRAELNSLLERNGTATTVTGPGDFADILRRRLFDGEPPVEVLQATANQFTSLYEDPTWTKNVWSQIDSGWRKNWAAEVAACYPFHPHLMAIAREEWSLVAGFQRVRSTIRIFAATVYAQQQRGKAGHWAPALIGPGDLPLSDSVVRDALLSSGLVEDDRTLANYRSLADLEVVSNDDSSGTARRHDLARTSLTWGDSNPRASERAATFVFLASIVGTVRPGRGTGGASAPEIKAACSVPGLAFTVTDADTVLEELVGPETGMSALETYPGRGHNNPARYFLSTRLTHRMLVNGIKRTITDNERDETIAEFAQRLASSGPFRDLRFVGADNTRTGAEVLATAGLDAAYTTRLVVLDPAQFSLRNGSQQATLEALEAATGLGTGPAQMPVQWASSCVFALANTQRRSNARGVAGEYIARKKALDAPEIQQDAELKATGSKELSDARAQLEKTLKRAFQHVAYLGQPDPDGERVLEQLTFEDEHSTGLDGTLVWKALVERGKVFDAGQFSARALLHNLRPEDYGRTLAEIRAAFYSAPRLPLLHAGDDDLRHAIYDAVATGSLAVVDTSGAPVAVTAPSQVNLASATLRLAEPAPPPSPEPADGTKSRGETAAGGGEGGTTMTGGETPDEETADRQVAFSFNKNLLGDAAAADDLAALFKALYQALDERQVSYGQGTLQLVVAEDVAEQLAARLSALGISPSVKPV